jgi:monocyte-to-macrophage differentiation protein
MIVPAYYGFKSLLQSAADNAQFANALLYGFAILFLFTTSTIYHFVSFCGKRGLVKFYLQLIDRSAIYLFIAASYSPWLTLKRTGSFGEYMRWVVWLLALTGIIYQYVFHEKYKLVDTILYVFTGVFPASSVLSMEEWSGVSFLAVGGCVYIFGVVFFKSDGKIPCAHAIWHLHVGVGAALHYYAVQTYLMGPRTIDDDHATAPLFAVKMNEIEL